MYCSFLMVKMVGISPFLLGLWPKEGVDQKTSHSAAITHTDCIQDLESNPCCLWEETYINSLWWMHGLPWSRAISTGSGTIKRSCEQTYIPEYETLYWGIM